MGKLVLFLPDGSTKAVNLAKERMVIGRRADNDLCLPYPAVSGEHAAVVTILDDSFLEDLHSTNGTLVNGATVQKHFLRDRDQIDIGRQKLVYLSDATAQVEADTLRALRKELKSIGVKVPKAASTDLMDDIEIELPSETEKAKPRKKAEGGREKSPGTAQKTASPRETLAEQPGAGGSRTTAPEAGYNADERSEYGLGVRQVEPVADRVRGPESGANRPAGDADPAAKAPLAPKAERGIGRIATSEVNASRESLSQRESNDRGLAHMARLRSGELSKGGSSNGDDGGSIADSPIENYGSSTNTVIESGGSSVDTVRLAEESVPQPVEPRMPPARITVLSGPSAGRSLLIERDEVIIGRVGLQVAAIDRGDAGAGFRLKLREGEVAPLLNGSPLADEGAALKNGDIFEVAGARLEFIAPR